MGRYRSFTGPFEDFRARLIERRWQLGLTQTALAARAGVTQSMISEWETGEVSPTDESLEMWVHALRGEIALRIDWLPEEEW